MPRRAAFREDNGLLTQLRGDWLDLTIPQLMVKYRTSQATLHATARRHCWPKKWAHLMATRDGMRVKVLRRIKPKLDRPTPTLWRCETHLAIHSGTCPRCGSLRPTGDTT